MLQNPLEDSQLLPPANVSPGVSKYLDDKIGCAVHRGRLIHTLQRTVDKSVDGDHLLNPIERADLRLYGCETIDNASPRRRLRVRHSKAVPKLTYIFNTICR